MESHQPSDDQAHAQAHTQAQDRVRAAGLRRVAVASVAALAVVLPLAVATAAAENGDGHRGNAGHSAEHTARSTADD